MVLSRNYKNTSLLNRPRSMCIVLKFGGTPSMSGECKIVCRVSRNRVPKSRPTTSFRPTWRLGPLLNDLVRRSGRPSPRRATLRGGASDQVPAERPYEAERSTKSPLSDPARRSGRPSPCRATLRGGSDDQLQIEQLSHPVSEDKPNANDVRARIRTHVHNDYINEHRHTVLG